MERAKGWQVILALRNVLSFIFSGKGRRGNEILMVQTVSVESTTMEKVSSSPYRREWSTMNSTQTTPGLVKKDPVPTKEPFNPALKPLVSITRSTGTEIAVQTASPSAPSVTKRKTRQYSKGDVARVEAIRKELGLSRGELSAELGYQPGSYHTMFTTKNMAKVVEIAAEGLLLKHKKANGSAEITVGDPRLEPIEVKEVELPSAIIISYSSDGVPNAKRVDTCDTLELAGKKYFLIPA